MLDWNVENFAKFWTDIEYNEAMKLKYDQFYDPDSCPGDPSQCDHDCDNCSAWDDDEEEECYYGFDVCIDPGCRDVENCLGCELLYGDKH